MGKRMDSFSFTKGWRSSPDTRSRKCILRISCKALCKTEKIKNLFAFAVQGGLEVIHSWISLHSFNHGVLTSSKLLCGSLFLLFCGTIVPAKQRSTGHVKDLLTRRTEQLQQRNTRGSDPVHAGSAEPAERKHRAADRADR